MDIRRLQKTGGSSMTITLPKKWIEKNHLKDKALLKISSPSEHSLLLQPSNIKRAHQKSVCEIDDLTDNMITRELIAHYISGAEDIIIISKRISPEQRNKIRDISNFLTGFEIVDETAEKITLRNIFDLTKLTIPKNIEKMFFTTTSMFDDVLKSFIENDDSMARDVIQRDFEVDKLQLIIKRLFHSVIQNKLSQDDLSLDISSIFYYEEIAMQLERIADHAEKIAVAKLNSENITHQAGDFSYINNIAGKISKLLEEAKEMVNTCDRNFAHTILESNEKIKKKLIVDYKESSLLNLINYSFDRVLGYITNIAESTIDLSIEKNLIK